MCLQCKTIWLPNQDSKKKAEADALFEEMVTFYHQNRTSGSLPAHLDENDCFTLSAILKILDWGVYYRSFIFEILAILKEWNISLTTCSKRSKKCKTSVENFYFVYPFSEKKFRNTSQVDKSWPRGKIDLHPTAPDKSSFLCRMVWNKKCPFWGGIQFSQRLRTQE